jgi:alpha-L-rhamnosidase
MATYDGSVEITDLRIERSVRPWGIDVAPRISWTPRSDARKVTTRTAEVRVLEGEHLVWRTCVTALELPEVECPLEALRPDTRYRVEVALETSHGRARASTTFRTGLIDGDWGGARWIRAPQKLSGPAPMLRTEFEVPATATAARLYLAAGGIARVELNGRVAGDEVLGPGVTAYHHRVQYLVWDVAELLVPGTNAISVELGRGFYAVASPNIWAWERSPWTDEPCVLARLVVDDETGTHEVLASDERFRAGDGPTRYDDIYGGETFDARHAVPAASRAGFDDSRWDAAALAVGPHGRLVHRRQQPIRVIDTLPLRVVRRDGDRILLDVGRVIAGWAAIEVSGPSGHRIQVRYSERLTPDGRPDQEDPLGYYAGRFQLDELVLAGDDPVRWESRFGWKGFRYIELDGWPHEVFDPDCVVARLVHNDVSRVGDFGTSDPTLEGLHRIAVATLLNNLHSIPTDTPAYEKNAWTADGMLGTEMFLLNLDAHEVLAKWVDDIADSRDDDGAPRVIAPHGGWSYDWSPAPPWHAAYVLVPWWLYERHGDRRVVLDHLDGILAYLELEYARSVDGIATSTLGDWMTPESDPVGSNPPEDIRVPATAFLAHAAQVASRLAEVAGRPSDAARMHGIAEHVAEAFRAAFLDAASATIRGDGEAGFRQSHQVLALAFGLVPAELRQPMADSIAQDVRRRGTHLNTGALSTKYLLPVLTEFGHAPLALELARQRSYPSWGYWLENGATTAWEHWSTQSRSLDHYFLATYDQWLFEAVAGIAPLDVGYRRIRIQPRFLGALEQAEGRIQTPYGTIAVEWVFRDDRLDLHVEIPIDTTAELVLPPELSAVHIDDDEGAGRPTEGTGYSSIELASGRYTLRAAREVAPADRLRQEG